MQAIGSTRTETSNVWRQIVAMKFPGLSLGQIRELLEAIAEAQLQCGASPALRKIIEVMEMETKHDWREKYHTEDRG